MRLRKVILVLVVACVALTTGYVWGRNHASFAAFDAGWEAGSYAYSEQVGHLQERVEHLEAECALKTEALKHANEQLMDVEDGVGSGTIYVTP